MVQETWKTRLTGDFDKAWRKVLHNGLLDGTASPAETVAVRPEAVSGYAATPAGDGSPWRWSSAPVRSCATARRPTTPGCRKCPPRSPRWSGTTWRSSDWKRRAGWG
ncbi:MAG: hypothetical protein U1G05_12125 [Kiritimatiellia bacterium]